MAQYKNLIIHCTATPDGRFHDSNDVRMWHLGPKNNQDGSVTYMGKTYPSRASLPNEMINGFASNVEGPNECFDELFVPGCTKGIRNQ